MTRTRRSIAKALLEQDAFEAALAKLAASSGLSVDAARRTAMQCLLEMVCVHEPFFSFLLDRGVGSLHTRAWTFDVDWAALDRLRRDHAGTSLVFLPTHRSYADAFVLMRALLSHRLPPTHILGGDNLRFFPLGTIGRRAGIIFIRRSFRDDEVYKLALRRYMHHLIESGASLEWYMEGGRSRTGKLRAPQYGLLRYLVDALAEAPGRDVVLVPVSITYDHLGEVGKIVAEDAGATKPREGTGWLVKYLAAQGERLGEAHVRFGAPLSLREAVREIGTEGAHRALDRVAFEVFQRINRVTPATATALVTLALLGVDGRALSLAQVHDTLQPLLDYAQARRLPTASLDRLRAPDGVERVLDRLAARGLIDRSGSGSDAMFRVHPAQHAAAAYYRNSAIHWFVNRAIFELGVMVAIRAGDGDALARGLGAARTWRDRLKFEFFFSDKATFDEEIASEGRLLAPDIGLLLSGRTIPATVLERAPFLIAHRILPPFLDAYRVLAEHLAAQPPGAAVDRKALLADSLAFLNQQALERKPRHPEAASREILANGLALATHRGLLEPGDATLAERRRQFAAELAEAVGALSAIAALDARLRPAPGRTS